MDIATAVKIAKTAGEEAARKVKEFIYDDGRKMGKAAIVIGLIIFILNLPTIFVIGLFGWMDADYIDSDTIQLDPALIDGFNSPILLMIYHPEFPDNIPFPDDTLKMVGNLHGLTWNEIEMCNVIYHAYVKNLNAEDSEGGSGAGVGDIVGGIINMANLTSTYTKLAKCFKEADKRLSYNSRLFNEFGFELTDDEYKALNHEYAYTPPEDEETTDT